MSLAPHEKILNELARAHLRPAGLVQKGRSRVWYEDHGWWLAVIELQPHGFRRGCALNVAAHWLWWGQDHISFDYAVAPDGPGAHDFVEFTNDRQFRGGIERLLRVAIDGIAQLREACASIDAVAARLREVPRRPAWPRANAGIACALAGDVAAAHEELRALAAEDATYGWHRALCERGAELDALVDDDAAFRRVIGEQIAVSRAALKLAAWSEAIA